jgi:hypothetical protein
LQCALILFVCKLVVTTARMACSRCREKHSKGNRGQQFSCRRVSAEREPGWRVACVVAWATTGWTCASKGCGRFDALVQSAAATALENRGCGGAVSSR